jgi:hypothetical protein
MGPAEARDLNSIADRRDPPAWDLSDPYRQADRR